MTDADHVFEISQLQNCLKTCTAQLPRKQHCFYVFDDDLGPMFIKRGSNFPYSCRVNLNRRENAKPQLDKCAIGCQALDNGVLSCDDPARLQAILNGLDARDHPWGGSLAASQLQALPDQTALQA